MKLAFLQLKINKFVGKYYFLSNFYENDVFWDGRWYRNNEAAFQSAKTLNAEERDKFAVMSPIQARHYGRALKDIRADWEDVKYDIMLDIVRAKFFQDPILARKLTDTKSRHLEEGNTWNDRTWGTVNGKGKNWLGNILMQVRDELREESV